MLGCSSDQSLGPTDKSPQAVAGTASPHSFRKYIYSDATMGTPAPRCPATGRSVTDENLPVRVVAGAGGEYDAGVGVRLKRLRHLSNL